MTGLYTLFTTPNKVNTQDANNADLKKILLKPADTNPNPIVSVTPTNTNTLVNTTVSGDNYEKNTLKMQMASTSRLN